MLYWQLYELENSAGVKANMIFYDAAAAAHPPTQKNERKNSQVEGRMRSLLLFFQKKMKYDCVHLLSARYNTQIASTHT